MVRRAVELPIPRSVDREASEQALRRFGYMVQETYETGQRTAIEQEELNGRQDLLSPLLDYGSVYMNGATAIAGPMTLPFSNQVGPMRGCELSGRRIRLLDRGLWDIRCQVWLNEVPAPGLTGVVNWEVRVLRPDLSLYSVQAQTNETQRPYSQTAVASVVVPEAGYFVEAYLSFIASFRSMRGGVNFNRLTVQHISRDVTTGDTGQ
ncbi:hypothetical protein [Rhodococcoides fascians]|uniref:hypothetical protein n=1 Tax=Rhodococcoides fascians TaxID=1828 RepID=UPI000689D19C|nr:hypothetical protein [Rhodococcus fascians]